MGKKGIHLLKCWSHLLVGYFFSPNVLLTGFWALLSTKLVKGCARYHHVWGSHTEPCKVTDSQGAINLYSVPFGTTTLLSTPLISVQVYLNSTSQEKKGTIYLAFDMVGF